MNAAWRERICYGPSGGGGGGSSQNTVTTSQQIPLFEQQQAQSNLDLANSLAAQPYPQYPGQIVAPFSPTQEAGQQAAIQSAGSFQPGLDASNQTIFNQLSQNPQLAGLQGVGAGQGMLQGGVGAGAGTIGGALSQNPLAGNPANAGVIQSYMNPFVQAALQPQLTAMQTQLGQQQNQIGAQATQANAFGDARQGSASALANFYGNQNMAGVLAGGYNTAYQNALQTATQQEQLGQAQQQLGIQGGQALGNLGISGGQALAGMGLNLGQLGIQSQGLGLQGAQQLAANAAAQQSLGLGGANAIYDVGAQQQQLTQQQDTAAGQQFQNQVQWPYQMLNLRNAALTAQPYSIQSQTTYPQANMSAQNLGAFASLAGLLGGGSSGAQAPFGGQAFNAAAAHA